MSPTFPIINYFGRFFEPTELDDYWAPLYLPKTNTPRPVVALWLIAVTEEFDNRLFEQPKIIDTIEDNLNKYSNSISGYGELITYYADLNIQFSILNQVKSEKTNTKREKRTVRNQRRINERELAKKSRRMSIFLSNPTWSTFDKQRNVYILTDTAPFSVFPSYFEYLKNQIAQTPTSGH